MQYKQWNVSYEYAQGSYCIMYCNFCIVRFNKYFVFCLVFTYFTYLYCILLYLLYYCILLYLLYYCIFIIYCSIWYCNIVFSYVCSSLLGRQTFSLAGECIGQKLCFKNSNCMFMAFVTTRGNGGFWSKRARHHCLTLQFSELLFQSDQWSWWHLELRQRRHRSHSPVLSATGSVWSWLLVPTHC